MSTKNLGQVSALSISATPPSNTYILWYDLSSNILKYFERSISSWEPIVSNDIENIGKIKLTSTGTSNFLSMLIDGTLTVEDDKLKVTNSLDPQDLEDLNTYISNVAAALATETTNRSNADTTISNDLSTNYFTKTQQGGLLTKVIEIGAWNMDADDSVRFETDIPFSKLVGISSVLIHRDDDNVIDWFAGAINEVAATTYGKIAILKYAPSNLAEIILHRTPSSFWDDTLYSNTSINRGHIIVQYLL